MPTIYTPISRKENIEAWEDFKKELRKQLSDGSRYYVGAVKAALAGALNGKDGRQFVKDHQLTVKEVRKLWQLAEKMRVVNKGLERKEKKSPYKFAQLKTMRDEVDCLREFCKDEDRSLIEFKITVQHLEDDAKKRDAVGDLRQIETVRIDKIKNTIGSDGAGYTKAIVKLAEFNPQIKAEHIPQIQIALAKSPSYPTRGDKKAFLKKFKHQIREMIARDADKKTAKSVVISKRDLKEIWGEKQKEIISEIKHTKETGRVLPSRNLYEGMKEIMERGNDLITETKAKKDSVDGIFWLSDDHDIPLLYQFQLDLERMKNDLDQLKKLDRKHLREVLKSAENPPTKNHGPVKDQLYKLEERYKKLNERFGRLMKNEDSLHHILNDYAEKLENERKTGEVDARAVEETDAAKRNDTLALYEYIPEEPVHEEVREEPTAEIPVAAIEEGLDKSVEPEIVSDESITGEVDEVLPPTDAPPPPPEEGEVPPVYGETIDRAEEKERVDSMTDEDWLKQAEEWLNEFGPKELPEKTSKPVEVKAIDSSIADFSAEENQKMKEWLEAVSSLDLEKTVNQVEDNLEQTTKLSPRDEEISATKDLAKMFKRLEASSYRSDEKKSEEEIREEVKKGESSMEAFTMDDVEKPDEKNKEGLEKDEEKPHKGLDH